jgi:hypothetical protein
MTEINIASAIDELLIFDDPEYCWDSNGTCSHYSVILFGNYTCDLFSSLGKKIRLDFYNNKLIKCDQCKIAWEKSKGAQ